MLCSWTGKSHLCRLTDCPHPQYFGLSERPLLPEGQRDLLVWDGFGPGLFGLIVASHIVLSKTHHSSPPFRAEQMLGSKAACRGQVCPLLHLLDKEPRLISIAKCLAEHLFSQGPWELRATVRLLASVPPAEACWVELLEKQLFPGVEVLLLLSFTRIPPPDLDGDAISSLLVAQGALVLEVTEDRPGRSSCQIQVLVPCHLA